MSQKLHLICIMVLSSAVLSTDSLTHDSEHPLSPNTLQNLISQRGTKRRLTDRDARPYKSNKRQDMDHPNGDLLDYFTPIENPFKTNADSVDSENEDNSCDSSFSGEPEKFLKFFHFTDTNNSHDYILVLSSNNNPLNEISPQYEVNSTKYIIPHYILNGYWIKLKYGSFEIFKPLIKSASDKNITPKVASDRVKKAFENCLENTRKFSKTLEGLISEGNAPTNNPTTFDDDTETSFYEDPTTESSKPLEFGELGYLDILGTNILIVFEASRRWEEGTQKFYPELEVYCSSGDEFGIKISELALAVVNSETLEFIEKNINGEEIEIKQRD